MRYYYGFDWTFFILIIPCMVLSLWASWNVKSTFKKYASQFSSRGITGAQAAEIVLRSNGVYNIRIERTHGSLTDHFDPSSNVIRLSDDVYGNTSTAAIGVACHEAGHAVQYAQDYLPIRIRTAIIPVTNLGSKLAMPLILAGVLISSLGSLSAVLIEIGICCYALAVVFQLLTLPVEFDASRRAMLSIHQSNILSEAESRGARKTLTAAALTYVAATAAALAQLLRLILIYGNRGNGNRRR